MPLRYPDLDIYLLKATVFTLFGGYACFAFSQSLPLDDLLGDEQLMSGLITRFTNLSWSDWMEADGLAYFSSWVQFVLGIWFTLCALASLTSWHHILKIGAVSLWLMTLLFWKNKFNQFPQLIEYAITIISPLLLVWYHQKKKPELLEQAAYWSIALTFAGHGLYALGIYPISADWLAWCSNVFNISSASAKQLLFVMGVLDWVAAILVVIPFSSQFKVLKQGALIYCIAWGFMTASARLIGTEVWYDNETTWLYIWLPECLVRLCNGLIPLLGLHLLNKSGNAEIKA